MKIRQLFGVWVSGGYNLYAPFNMGKFRLVRVCTKHVVYKTMPVKGLNSMCFAVGGRDNRAGRVANPQDPRGERRAHRNRGATTRRRRPHHHHQRHATTHSDGSVPAAAEVRTPLPSQIHPS
jgi:hypothetical protein